MDALEALGEDRLDAEEKRALRRPVPRAAGAVLLAGDDDERCPCATVALRRVEDAHLLAAREVARPIALALRRERVPQTHVAERAAHHHLVVAATRAVAVELTRRDSMRDEEFPGRAVRGDRARRRDVVGRDRVAEEREHARPRDVAERRRRRRQVDEERRLLDVRRLRVPRVQGTLGDRERAPRVVAVEHGAVALAEEVRAHRLAEDRLHLGTARPHVAQVDVVPVGVGTERLAREIDVDAARERVGDDERRRREIRRAHQRMDASFEIAVAAQHRGDDEIVVADRGRDRVRERAGVPDAVVDGDAARDERVHVVDGEIVDRPGARRPAVEHLERERRQG